VCGDEPVYPGITSGHSRASVGTRLALPQVFPA